MDGVGIAPFLASVRAALGRDIPVVLCTGHPDGPFEAKRLAIDLLCKPFEPNDVVKLMKQRTRESQETT